MERRLATFGPAVGFILFLVGLVLLLLSLGSFVLKDRPRHEILVLTIIGGSLVLGSFLIALVNTLVRWCRPKPNYALVSDV